MRCTSARTQLSRYMDGELGTWRKARLERHLEACSRCRLQLEADRKVWALLDAQQLEEVPDCLGKLEARLDREQRAVVRCPSRLAPLAYAAALALSVGAGAIGGAYAAKSATRVGSPSVDPNYAEFLGDAPPGLAPIASILARTP